MPTPEETARLTRGEELLRAFLADMAELGLVAATSGHDAVDEETEVVIDIRKA